MSFWASYAAKNARLDAERHGILERSADEVAEEKAVAAALRVDTTNIRKFLSAEEIAAQQAFAKSLSEKEKLALSHYITNGYGLITSVLTRAPARGFNERVIRYAEEAKLSEPPSKLGFIPTLIGNFTSMMYKAPKTTRVLNLYRGIHSPRALNIDGSTVLSTSYNREIAVAYAEGGCCILEVSVMPGVRIIAVDIVNGNTGEDEIMVCPPYNAKIEDIGENVKKVTITPVERRRAGTRSRTRSTRGLRTRRRLRQTKKLTSKL
jgi:hypothetical protein